MNELARTSEGTSVASSKENTQLPAELVRARATIDNIDAALIHILAERFRCTQSVGHIKAQYDLPPADPEREAYQVIRMRTLAEQSGLDPDFAEKFLSFMVTEVIRHHEDIKDSYSRDTKHING
ncbi:chorismate mutase [Schaalia sp. lx-260]|uniref:chorismate mutase n=1 Tax=Schaalia sp. lx-260 TaxID=2899082 RepID=UPI001E56AE36|nr:chorismate mutase [Schaalia sp. lx-260]MCD4549623.1 chorismate mutase [Schaalia sp. lx-260]